MSLFHDHEYNFDASPYLTEPFWDFRNMQRAGEVAEDFTLPTLDGGTVTLSDLRGKPVLIEFGVHNLTALPSGVSAYGRDGQRAS